MVQRNLISQFLDPFSNREEINMYISIHILIASYRICMFLRRLRGTLPFIYAELYKSIPLVQANQFESPSVDVITKSQSPAVSNDMFIT